MHFNLIGDLNGRILISQVTVACLISIFYSALRFRIFLITGVIYQQDRPS